MSTPCHGDDIKRYGGNTSCVSLAAPGENPIIFDLGTGLRYKGVGCGVVLVASAGLGTLNTAALTAEALAARSLPLLGVVIGSWPDQPGLAEGSNLVDLPRVTGAPLWGRIPERAGRMTRERFLEGVPTWLGHDPDDA